MLKRICMNCGSCSTLYINGKHISKCDKGVENAPFINAGCEDHKYEKRLVLKGYGPNPASPRPEPWSEVL